MKTKSPKKIKLPRNIPLDDLRARRDIAVADGNLLLAFAIARRIDKVKGY